MTRKVGLKNRRPRKTKKELAEKGRIHQEKKRVVAELDRRKAEKTRQAAETIRWESMNQIQALERARESAELMHSSLLDRIQNYIEQMPKIIDDFKRAAANQLEEMEKISASAQEMLQAAQEMIQKASKQKKTRS